MANYMDDEDDGGMGLQMIPKPGAQGMAPAPQMADPNAINMRPILAQAGQDKRMAQQGWQQALDRRNSQKTIDSMQQYFNPPQHPVQAPPQGVSREQRSQEDQLDALRNQMLEERAGNNGQMTPEAMAKFQRLKAMITGGAQPNSMVAGHPEDDQDQ